MYQNTGVALSRVAGGAPFSATPVSGILNQAIFGEPTEYELDGITPSDIIGTILRLVGASDSSLALSLPVGLPEAQSRAIRDAIGNPFIVDHSTAFIHLHDYRSTDPEGGALNVLFVDVTPGQLAAKLSSTKSDNDEWLITPEEKTILRNEQAEELLPQDIIEKLVIPTVPSHTRLDRIYILRPEGPSSEVSSALEAKFPTVPVKWASLTDLSRGAAAAINRRPAETTQKIPCALLILMPVGVTLNDGRVVTVARRNTFLPTSKTVILTTSRDNQTKAIIKFVTGNKSSGRVVLDGLAPRPRGVARIQVTFDIDHNGDAVVTVEDLGSGTMTIGNLDNVTNYTREELEAYLSLSKTIPNQAKQSSNKDGVLGELPG